MQPEKRLSGESGLSDSHDVVAISAEGVKVITIEGDNLHPILTSGSPLYRKYLERRAQQERAQSLEMAQGDHMSTTEQLLGEALRNLNILELLNCNSALRKLSAVQKRHLESLAEGPVSFLPGERIWRSGAPVDKAFIIVSGTASFVPRRRNAGSANVPNTPHKYHPEQGQANCSIGEEMRKDAEKAIKELVCLLTVFLALIARTTNLLTRVPLVFFYRRARPILAISMTRSRSHHPTTVANSTMSYILTPFLAVQVAATRYHRMPVATTLAN